MKRQELIVEHFINHRLLKVRRFRAGRKIVFGSGLSAHVRLSGNNISGVHAIIEKTGPDWTVFDLTATGGVQVDNEVICEKSFNEPMTVQIGEHTFKLTPLNIEENLFKGRSEKLSGAAFHQIFVKFHDRVIYSKLMPAGESFKYQLHGQAILLAPPKLEEGWHESKHINHSFHHRLITSEQFVEIQKGYKLEKADQRAVMAAGLIMLFMLGSSLFVNFSHKNEKAESNKFSQLIFDAKITKEKKAESQKVAKEFKKKQLEAKPNLQKSQASAAPSSLESKPTAKKVLTNIKAAQLGQILGRISARASKSMAAVSAVGVSIGDRPSSGAAAGAGMPSVSGLAGQVGNGKLSNSRYKMAAVGTSGKGGGTSDLKGVGGLKSANIGTAEVSMIEEETEVDGGLDREVIAQYIKSQLGQIRYCYERQLSANPDLYGKVQVQFTIGGTGDVAAQSIGLSTLKSAMVEGCILRRVAGWRFPTPKGGTTVKVTYPFLFKSTN